MLNAATFGLANSIATSFGTTDIYGDYVDPITRKESRADLTLQAVMSVIPIGRVTSGASEVAVRSASSLARLETRMASAEVSAAVADGVAGRQMTMLQKNVGYNISPENWFGKYSALGRQGTFLTDYRAVGEILGPVRANQQFKVGLFSSEGQVSYLKAWRLERALAGC